MEGLQTFMFKTKKKVESLGDSNHGGIILWSGKRGVTRVNAGGGRTLCTLHRGKGQYG